jgi:peptidoglycan-associated lipoprotein
MIKRLLLLFFVLSTAITLVAQPDEFYSKLTKKADITYSTNEYYKALNLYKDNYKKSTNKFERAYIQFRIAECYRKMNETIKAESSYQKAIQRGYSEPICILYYADMLKKNEKYADAATQYNEYLKYKPDDAYAKMGYKSCSMAADWMEYPTRYVIENRKELNSKEGDFAPAFANEDFSDIYFTSSREGLHGEKINPVTGTNFTDIFESELNRKGDWSKPAPISDTVNSVNDDGTPDFANNYNDLYFTRCKIIRGIKLGCQIYKSTRQAGEDWATCEQITIAGDSVTAGHPSVSPDGLTMYFVSNKPGGFGGNDIYMMTRTSKSKSFSNPVNLGMNINTSGDELYPYIRENGILYFASNGHPGMGGLDIFKATKNDDGEWVVENMRYPINSSADDFAIVFKKNAEEGLFSSSRKGGRGKDDIYSFVLPPMEFILQGVVKDATTDKPIKGAKIRIVGSDGTDLDITTLDDGSFKYKLNPHTDYIYLAKKDGYLNQKGKITTAELADSKTFTDEIRLSGISNPVEVDNVFYDFGKWELRPESKKELNTLIDILHANPNITIELASHTDMIGDSLSNIILSQRRAQSVIDYLIEKGIPKEMLTAKGYGKNIPQTISPHLAQTCPFKEGTVLSADFINTLPTQEQKDIANQLNRRTEFKVTSTNFIPDIEDE